MKYRKKIIPLFLLFSPCIILSLDQPKLTLDLDIPFQHFSYEEGLLMAPTAILQDHLGYLWFATSAGIYRYDGYDFELSFPRTGCNTDTLSRIQGICEDDSGNIWFGQYAFGIYKLDRMTRKFKHFYHDPIDPSTLSGKSVGGMYLDSHGFLWIAAISEHVTDTVYLDRLDTRSGQVKHYRHNKDDPNSLTIDSVLPAGIGYWNPLVIIEDTNTDVWIGLLNSGVVRYNRQKDNFSRFVHNPDDPTSLSSNEVKTITAGNGGAVWICTSAGLNRFDPATQSFVHYRHDQKNSNSLASDSCFAVFQEQSKLIWITHQKGMDRYNPETGIYEHFQHDPDNPKSLSRADSYLPVYEDDHGAVWILTQGDFSAIDIFDPNTRSFQRFENSPDKPTGFHVSNFFSFLADRSHTMWIGSGDGILNKIYTNTNRFYTVGKSGNLQTSLPSNNIRDMLVSKKQEGVIWIATSEGLSRLEWHRGTFENFQHDPNDSNSLYYNDIRCIDEDDHGSIWLGTKNGLDKLDDSGFFTHFSHDPNDSTALSENNIVNICYDPKGYLWICTESGGFNRLDINSGRVKRYVKKAGDPTSIDVEMQTTITYVDRLGTPWIGTDQGLNKFDYQTGQFSNVSDAVAMQIHEDKWGTLWVGAYAVGLFNFDRETRKRIFFQTGHPLAHCSIRDIVEDEDGLLWISTNHGLVKLDPRDNSCLSLSSQHGLPETQFLTCGVKLTSGWMLWGTSSKGLILFDPHSIRQNMEQPQVVITDIRVSDKSLTIGGDSPLKCDLSYTTELDLQHDQNDISFVCAALDFVRPEKNQYAFWLEKYDGGWHEAGTNRVATYTNLDPGKYIFHVKASNSEGLWNEEGTSLLIHIHPPWYAAWWAYSIYFLTIVGIVYALWTNQVRRIHLRNELQLKNVQAEKLQEIDGIKTRFLANISHEFRTPLTLILGPIEQLLKKVKDSELTAEIKIMRRNAQRLARLVNQLLDLSKIEAGKMTLKVRQDDIVSFVNRIVQSFESRARLKQIDLSFHSSQPFLQTYIDHEKIENVLYNLIANAVKFTPEYGRISVTIDKKESLTELTAFSDRTSFVEGAVAIAVQDNGPGIAEEQLNKIFDRFYQVEGRGAYQETGTGIGLALAKELVELHHGFIIVKSNLGEGSVFTVLLPLGRTHLTEEEIVESSHIPQPSLAETECQLSLRTFDGRLDRNAPAVLIVEDNADLRYYIQNILKNFYRVFEADGGMHGFDLAAKEIPDLIITDVMMPGMDGFELCEKLKTDAHTSHIPVILLTARADIDSKIHGLETGADDYLIKPFNETELHVRVNNLIQQRQKLRLRFSRDILTPMKDIAVTSTDERFLQRAVDLITQHMSDTEFNLALLCKHIGLSRSQLHRKLKAIVNLSTTEFIRTIRLRRAAELLKSRFGNIAEIAYEVGFSNPAYFSNCFLKQFGILPSEYMSE
jgi:signal transduction histidine kinase/ligand-binding sensor domain-containing protein/DNA-binding response OmpR family regulator